MGTEMPQSMDDCMYFTRRNLVNNGNITAWAHKVQCPECREALMGKPVAKGHVQIRANRYQCPKCGHEEEKSEHESKVQIVVKYKCPFCSKSGETATEYRRKKYLGVDAYVFSCSSCGEKIGITKKLKQVKK